MPLTCAKVGKDGRALPEHCVAGKHALLALPEDKGHRVGRVSGGVDDADGDAGRLRHVRQACAVGERAGLGGARLARARVDSDDDAIRLEGPERLGRRERDVRALEVTQRVADRLVGPRFLPAGAELRLVRRRQLPDLRRRRAELLELTEEDGQPANVVGMAVGEHYVREGREPAIVGLQALDQQVEPRGGRLLARRVDQDCRRVGRAGRLEEVAVGPLQRHQRRVLPQDAGDARAQLGRVGQRDEVAWAVHWDAGGRVGAGKGEPR